MNLQDLRNHSNSNSLSDKQPKVKCWRGAGLPVMGVGRNQSSTDGVVLHRAGAELGYLPCWMNSPSP